MLKCCSLYSGSSGNSFFVQSEKVNILIDAGVSCKKIETALDKKFNLSLNNINAIFITHEHVDHTKGLNLIASKYNIPVYASNGTLQALGSKISKIPVENINVFALNKSFTYEDLRIYPFSTPHDAAEPCGFNIYCGKSKISIATDIGYIDENVLNNLKQSSFIMLESNYEPNLLKLSSYPYLLKQRISSNSGHLSNIAAGEAIVKLIDSGLKDALLVHLSKQNNMPEIAYQTVVEGLKKHNHTIDNVNLHIAPRDNPSQIFLI